MNFATRVFREVFFLHSTRTFESFFRLCSFTCTIQLECEWGSEGEICRIDWKNEMQLKWNWSQTAKGPMKVRGLHRNCIYLLSSFLVSTSRAFCSCSALGVQCSCMFFFVHLISERRGAISCNKCKRKTFVCSRKQAEQ